MGYPTEKKETLFEEKQKEEAYIRFLKHFSGYEIVRWVTTLIIKYFSWNLNDQDEQAFSAGLRQKFKGRELIEIGYNGGQLPYKFKLLIFSNPWPTKIVTSSCLAILGARSKRMNCGGDLECVSGKEWMGLEKGKGT